MPDGVGIPIVAPLVLVLQHHFVNTRPHPVVINAALNIERVDEANVEEAAMLVFDDILDLSVPPGGQRVVQRTCGFDRDVQLALVSTHTHERTDCATLNRYAGSTGEVDAEPFFVNKSWEAPPILHFAENTFLLSEGDGIHWACHIADSRGDGVVNDGTASGEMCVFAAVAYPAPLTKEEIMTTLTSGNLIEVYGILDQVMTSCSSYPEVGSPWPMTEEANMAPPVDTCEAWSQTESNTLD